MLEEAAGEVRSAGGEAIAVAADVTSEADVDRVVRTALERFGAVDVVVNNAGAAPFLARLDQELSWDEWRRHVDVDVRGVFNTCRRVLPLLREQGSGTIVNVSSGAAVAASPLHFAYTPAKLAVVGMSRCLATDARDAGVAVHCLCPDITPEGEVGRSAIETFARERGVTPEEWLTSFGPAASNTAGAVGAAVVELLDQPSGVWHVGGAGLARWELLAPPPARG